MNNKVRLDFKLLNLSPEEQKQFDERIGTIGQICAQHALERFNKHPDYYTDNQNVFIYDVAVELSNLIRKQMSTDEILAQFVAERAITIIGIMKTAATKQNGKK